VRPVNSIFFRAHRPAKHDLTKKGFQDIRKEQNLFDVGNMAEWLTLLIIFLTFTTGNFYDGLCQNRGDRPL
jgi:hypothetical protein